MNTVDSKPDSAPQESIQGRIAALQASSWWRQASSSSAVDYYELVWVMIDGLLAAVLMAGSEGGQA